MTSHKLRVPKAIREYFAQFEDCDPSGATGELYIAQEFTPSKGWKRTSFHKRPSASWGRKLRNEGVTSVAIRCGDHLADFRTDELIGKTGLRG